MAEDQGVNGDLWNEEASRLLKALGWKQVGDSNLDVKNEEGKKHGLDGIYVYSDPKRNSSISQGVFVEAKCYKTSSFSKTALKEWILTLNKKLTKTKNSELFQNTFPTFGSTLMSNGLIVIWFSDLENYNSFKDDFREMKAEIKIPARSSTATPNKIYVLDNFDILRLASLVTAKMAFEKLKNTNLKFYYPSSDIYNNPADRKEILTLDYMFSKFILAETVIEGIEYKVVFYFGDLSYHAFLRLKNVLQNYSFTDKDKPLTIFIFNRDQEFRKVKPDVQTLFEDVSMNLEEMEIYYDLPTFLRKK